MALEAALPGVEFVDIAQPSMWMRAIKSNEELALIREPARGSAISAGRRAQGNQGGRTGT
jgi:creatinase